MYLKNSVPLWPAKIYRSLFSCRYGQEKKWHQSCSYRTDYKFIFFIERFSFECRKVIGFGLLRYAIGLKNSRHFFIQSGVKPKPIVIHSYAFSRALRQLHVITSCFDWFTWLSVSFVIGWSDYFGFGFTTLDWKPL